MKYVDAHCHLESGILPSCIAVAITNATRIADWDFITKVSGHGCVHGAIGIHPWYISELPNDWDCRLYKMLSANSELMVGEIGLDKNSPDLSAQMDVFQRQLQIAIELRRTVHIHCIGAWDKLLAILAKFTPHTIVLHGASPSIEIINLLLRYNSYFSFGPALCKETHIRIRNAFCNVPQSRILSETDGNNPADVVMVVQKMSEILAIPVADVADTIYTNVIGLLKNG